MRFPQCDMNSGTILHRAMDKQHEYHKSNNLTKTSKANEYVLFFSIITNVKLSLTHFFCLYLFVPRSAVAKVMWEFQVSGTDFHIFPTVYIFYGIYCVRLTRASIH